MKDTKSQKKKPHLRLVDANELVSVQPVEPQQRRHRSQMIEQMTDMCDQIDKEIDRLLRL